MKKLDNIKYEKINYKNYEKRIDNILNDPELIELGLSKKTIAKTEYGYDLDCFSIGYGDHDIFLVAGTHSCEIITIDFITQLMENIKYFPEFDPSYFKLNIIPIQNPEGFDIVASIINSIDEDDFEKKSYEYYLRYRTDSIIYYALKSLNEFVNNLNSSEYVIEPNDFLRCFKKFIKNNNSWKRLGDKRAIPNIVAFNKAIDNINNVKSYEDFKNKILIIIDTINSNLDTDDHYLDVFLQQLRIGFEGDSIWNEVKASNQIKLFQEMFKDAKINNLKCYKLEEDINKVYKLYNHPKGSQIVHDSTGSGINLNANNEFNPGINSTRDNKVIYGPGVKSNIKNYFPGPLGVPTKDINNFEYAIENKALYKLINDSYNKETYMATLLYHGTGGLIFYKPYKDLMDDNDYDNFKKYNYELASIYRTKTDYKILDISSNTGYGDLLRREFPGVLLIELSKMGGNPLSPYGDRNNIYNTINDNLEAFRALLRYLSKDNVKRRVLKI